MTELRVGVAASRSCPIRILCVPTRGTSSGIRWGTGMSCSCGESSVIRSPSRFGIPQEYLFRAGGIQSVRGYPFQSLGVQEGSAVVGRVLATQPSNIIIGLPRTGVLPYSPMSVMPPTAGNGWICCRLWRRHSLAQPGRPARTGSRPRSSRRETAHALFHCRGILTGVHRPDMEHRVKDNLPRKSGAPRWQPAALLVSVFVVMVAGFGVWLTTSTSGLMGGSTVSHLSSGQISIEGLDGTLMGPLSAHVVRLTADDSVAVSRNVTLHWQPGSLRSGLLEITSLAVEDIEIISPPSSEPRSLQTLELPIGVSLYKLDIGVLRVLHEKDGKPDFAATQLIASFLATAVIIGCPIFASGWILAP